MKFKKVIFTSMAAVSLGAVVSPAISRPQNTVNAATKTKSLTKNVFVYNAKGKRIKKVKLAKGKKIKILGTKLINGKKYYRIGKNQYIKVASFKTSQNPQKNVTPSQNKPESTVTNTTPAVQEPTQSKKQLIDPSASLTAQIHQALQYTGQDRYDAEAQIAEKLGITGISGRKEEFDQQLQAMANQKQETKNWIEQGRN